MHAFRGNGTSSKRASIKTGIATTITVPTGKLGEQQVANHELIMDLMRNGRVENLAEIAANDADLPNGFDAIGRRWIINAISIGTVSVVKWFLEQRAQVIFRDDEGYTVLHAAIERSGGDQKQIMCELINSGADINLRGFNDWTPLHMAAARNNISLVELLLGYGADTEAKTNVDFFARPDEEAEYLGAPDAANLIREWRERKRGSPV